MEKKDGLAILPHTKTLISEGRIGCIEHYHLSTNVFIINWIATTFIHWNSGQHKNYIETHLTHMNELLEQCNEVMKSLEKGSKCNWMGNVLWKYWLDWTGMDGQVIYLCIIRLKDAITFKILYWSLKGQFEASKFANKSTHRQLIYTHKKTSKIHTD